MLMYMLCAMASYPFYILVSQQFYCMDAKSCEGLSMFRYNAVPMRHWLKTQRRMKLKNSPDEGA